MGWRRPRPLRGCGRALGPIARCRARTRARLAPHPQWRREVRIPGHQVVDRLAMGEADPLGHLPGIDEIIDLHSATLAPAAARGRLGDGSVGGAADVARPPLDVVAKPEASGRDLAHRLRKPRAAAELVGTLPAHAEEDTDLRRAHQVELHEVRGSPAEHGRTPRRPALDGWIGARQRVGGRVASASSTDPWRRPRPRPRARARCGSGR